MSELVLIAIVALVVFNPSKWPMLAHHVAKGWRLLKNYQQQATEFWQHQLALYQLQENNKKAATADKHYHSATDDQSPT